jgi:peptidyl-prolyl cis-trans isomerase D
MEANLRQQYGAGINQSILNQQALEQTWNQEVDRLVLSSELDKLGLEIGKKELGDILYGTNAPADLQRQFTDEKTGQYNAALAKQNIDQMLKKGSPQQKADINNYINALVFQRRTEKYMSMLTGSVNYPRWYVEKQNADNSQLAKVSFVREYYTSIPDTSIKITDKEIADYISQHKDDFKQVDSRSISYVAFSAAPSGADSAEVRSRLLSMKEEFDSTANMEQFLMSQGVSNYYNGHISGKAIQIAVKDSIFKTPVGGVYGPYLDGNSFVLARLESVRSMPDTVKIRHILVATSQRDPQSGQMYPVRDSASARKIIDSVQTVLRAGSNFDSVCVKVSEDPGSKDNGGVYDNVSSGQMVGAFNDFIFLNPVGSKGIVKTDFGFHYIEILSQKGSTTGYKIAYLPKEIIPSQQTDADALQAANNFAADIKDQKSFDEVYEKTLKPKGLTKGIATDIAPVAAEIRGLGFSRAFVRSVYEASLGEVIKPERIEDNYVVAVVTEVFKEGTMSTARARAQVEPLLRSRKKAEMLRQKVGKVTTLEAAAQALNNRPVETADSVRLSLRNVNNTLGYEPRVIGAAFNPANKGQVVPEVIEGLNGVYVLRVDNISATSSLEGSVADQRKILADQNKQFSSNPQSPAYPLNALRKAATITDKRTNRY